MVEDTLDSPIPDRAVRIRRGVGVKFFAKNGYSGTVKKKTNFVVGEDGAEFVKVKKNKLTDFDFMAGL